MLAFVQTILYKADKLNGLQIGRKDVHFLSQFFVETTIEDRVFPGILVTPVNRGRISFQRARYCALSFVTAGLIALRISHRERVKFVPSAAYCTKTPPKARLRLVTRLPSKDTFRYLLCM